MHKYLNRQLGSYKLVALSLALTIERSNIIFFENGPSRPIFCLFSSFRANITTNRGEKCPSSIRCWDFNPRPSGQESPPLPLDQGTRRNNNLFVKASK